MGWHFLSLCINYSPVPRHTLHLQAPHLHCPTSLARAWQWADFRLLHGQGCSQALYHLVFFILAEAFAWATTAGWSVLMASRGLKGSGGSDQEEGRAWNWLSDLEKLRWSQLRWKPEDKKDSVSFPQGGINRVLSPAMSLLYKLWKTHLCMAANSKRRQLWGSSNSRPLVLSFGAAPGSRGEAG